jgi:hypothetical protein
VCTKKNKTYVFSFDCKSPFCCDELLRFAENEKTRSWFISSLLNFILNFWCYKKSKKIVLQFVCNRIASRTSRNNRVCDLHVSHSITEISLDRCHRSSFLLFWLFNELIFGSNCNVFDSFYFHTAGSVGKSLGFLRWLTVCHVHSYQVVFKLQLKLLVLFLQWQFLLLEAHTVDSRSVVSHPKHFEFFEHMNDAL